VISKSQWESARLRYETRPDCTQQDIADELGCSRQCVHNHVKKAGWIKFTGVDKELPSIAPRGKYVSSLRSDENIAKLLDTYALTGNKAKACKQVGIDDKTLYRWCQDDSEFALTLRNARDDFLLGQLRQIADHKDWKSAKEILSRAPETKDEWGEVHDSGPTIVLNIHRDEVTVEGNVVESVAVEESEEPLPEPPTLEPDEEPEAKRPGDVDVPKKEATETATEPPQFKSIRNLPFPPRDPEGARERDRLEKERTENCWQGENISEKKALSEQQALEQRVMGLSNK